MALGGFIQVGVASSSPWRQGGVWWEVFDCELLFNALALAVQTGLSNISADLSRTDLKCCVTNCGGLFQNLVGQPGLFQV